MNNIKFIKQNNFGNRKIIFNEYYGGVKEKTRVDGTSVPKRNLFLFSFVIFITSYFGFIDEIYLWILPSITFLVILPESNGLFFMPGARHDLKYQNANSFLKGKILADYEFLIDMIKTSLKKDCSIYTNIVGTIRALFYFLGVIFGGWFSWYTYFYKNKND